MTNAKDLTGSASRIAGSVAEHLPDIDLRGLAQHLPALDLGGVVDQLPSPDSVLGRLPSPDGIVDRVPSPDGILDRVPSPDGILDRLRGAPIVGPRLPRRRRPLVARVAAPLAVAAIVVAVLMVVRGTRSRRSVPVPDTERDESLSRA